MACDYLVSLELWLKPKLTIQERQRVLLLQLLSSIYEGILSEVVDNLIRTKKGNDPAFKTTFHDGLYGDKRTFGPTLRLAFDFDIIDDHWKSYLDKLREARNWIHLSNTEKVEVKNWMMGRPCEEHRNKLNTFKNYIKGKF
jgi:hypothetical protein